MDFIAKVVLALVPLIIAVDPAASVTVFLSLAEGLDHPARHRILRDALVTAFAIGVGFLFLGAFVFRLLGIDKADFQIGGGLILVVLSLADLVAGDRARRRRSEFIGIVPIGTPLIVGPAVLTAITILQVEYGNAVTVSALVAVLAVTGLALLVAEHAKVAIGTGGLMAVSKIISILLAGFGVHLVRTGLSDILAGAGG
jgi:multiple antibiotic resistance protein